MLSSVLIKLVKVSFLMLSSFQRSFSSAVFTVFQIVPEFRPTLLENFMTYYEASYSSGFSTDIYDVEAIYKGMTASLEEQVQKKLIDN